MSKVTEKLPVLPKDPAEDHVLMSTCYVCNLVYSDPTHEDNCLLVCDACDFSVAHYECLGYDAVPPEEDNWTCERCAR
jgi:hypothetical protein